MFRWPNLEKSEYFRNKGLRVFILHGTPCCVADPKYRYFILATSFIPFPAPSFMDSFKLAFGINRQKLTSQFILCCCCFCLLSLAAAYLPFMPSVLRLPISPRAYLAPSPIPLRTGTLLAIPLYVQCPSSFSQKP